MRAMFALALALSMAMAGLVMVGSGFNAAVGQGDVAPTISEELEDKANSSQNGPASSFSSSARNEDDGSIAGFIISGAGDVAKAFAMVALLPVTLRNLGFPRWFSYPIGLGFYVVVALSIAQVASGRIIR